MQSNLPISIIVTPPESQPEKIKHCSEGQKTDQARNKARKSRTLPLSIPLSVRISDRIANTPWTEAALYKLAQTTSLVYTTHNDIADRLTTALADDKALPNNKVIDLMHYYMDFYESDDNVQEYLYGHCYQKGKLSNLNCLHDRLEFNSVPALRIEAFINVVFGIRYINTIPDPNIKQQLNDYQEKPNRCDSITWNYLFGLIKKENIMHKNDLFERYYPKAVEQKTFRRDVLKFVIDHFLNLVEEIINNMLRYEKMKTQAGEAAESRSVDRLSISTDRSGSATGSFISISSTANTTSNQSSKLSQPFEPQKDTATHTIKYATLSVSNQSLYHSPTISRKTLKTLNTMKYPPALMNAIKRHIDSYKVKLTTAPLLQNNESTDTGQKIIFKRRLDQIKTMFSNK